MKSRVDGKWARRVFRASAEKNYRKFIKHLRDFLPSRPDRLAFCNRTSRQQNVAVFGEYRDAIKLYVREPHFFGAAGGCDEFQTLLRYGRARPARKVVTSLYLTTITNKAAVISRSRSRDTAAKPPTMMPTQRQRGSVDPDGIGWHEAWASGRKHFLFQPWYPAFNPKQYGTTYKNH
jgi:hypothetical protein